MIRHLEEVQDLWHPSGVRMTMRFPPEVFALLRPAFLDEPLNEFLPKAAISSTASSNDASNQLSA
jgi:hypothetical protein